MTTAIILFIPVVGDDPRSHPEPRLQDSGRETDRVQLRDEGHVGPDSPGDGTTGAAARRLVTGGQSTLGPCLHEPSVSSFFVPSKGSFILERKRKR